MRSVLLVVGVLLMQSAPLHAGPITTLLDAPCHCTWEIEAPTPNVDPDPPQTYEEWVVDLGHEPPPSYVWVCPIEPVVQTPEPGVWGLAMLGFAALGFCRRGGA